jgi:hypothetical protein
VPHPWLQDDDRSEQQRRRPVLQLHLAAAAPTPQAAQAARTDELGWQRSSAD